MEHNHDEEDFSGMSDYDEGRVAPEDYDEGSEFPDSEGSWCDLCGNPDNGFDHECDEDEDDD